MAKRHLLSLLCILCLTSCSHVDVDDRLIYVEPPVVEPVQEDDTITIKPSVLIEDFTGQRCVNCPTAAEEIQRLKTQYGDSTIVAVGIHSGPLAVFPTDKAVGLRTQQGDDYYQHWNIDAEPAGHINRNGTISTPDLWQTQVRNALSQPANVSLRATSHYDADTRSLAIQVEIFSKITLTGHLQIWLTESDIIALQMMPNGKANRDYVHNHVFRTAVNGAWGDPCSLSEKETKTLSFTATIDQQWIPENLSVVAFLYNDTGVLQVTENHVKTP